MEIGEIEMTAGRAWNGKRSDRKASGKAEGLADFADLRGVAGWVHG